MVLAAILSVLAFGLIGFAFRGEKKLLLAGAGFLISLALCLILASLAVRLPTFPCKPLLMSYRAHTAPTLAVPPDLEAVTCLSPDASNECVNGYGARLHKVKENPGKSRVLFLGDSFTFGMGMADNETFPAALQSLKNFNTMNLGASGTGINSIYDRFTERAQPLPKEKFAFAVYTFIPNHFSRAIGADGFTFTNALPHFTLSEGELKFQGTFFESRYAGAWIFLFGEKLLTTLAACQPGRNGLLRATSVSEDELALTKALILASQKEFQKRYGGEFVLNIWPGSEFPGKKEFIAELSKQMPVLEFTKPSALNSASGHPTQKANQEMAEFLDTELRRLEKAKPSR